MLTLEKVKIIPQLMPAEVGRWLANDVPSVEEVEDCVSHGTENWILVPHDGTISQRTQLVCLAVVHDHDHSDLHPTAKL